MKLGYGGTKEEMARLLADASELAGKEFEMGNFADIIEAIHVIQENMGITGTTAEEASGTINGSILAWKSALDNLLTGIGRNENIDQLVDNLVDSTEDVIANLVPAIRRASEGFMQVMRVAVVKVGPQVMDAFRDIWNNKLPTMLTSAANGIIGLINDLFGTNIPKIETIELPSWGDISAKVILWAETVRNRIRAITKWTIGIFTAPTETATEMTTTFTRWWEETAKPTILSISTWALNLFGMPEADENSITSHVQTWWGGIVEWVQNACVWTLQMFGFAPDAAENAVLKVKQWFAGVIKTIGNALMVVFNWASGMDAADLQAEVETIYEDAKTLIGQTLEFAWSLVPGPIQEKLQPLVDGLSEFWKNNEDTIRDLIEGLVEVYDMISGVVIGMFSDALSDDELWSSIGSTLMSFIEAAKSIAEALAPVAEAASESILVSIKNALDGLKAVLDAIAYIALALKMPLEDIASVIDGIADAILILSGNKGKGANAIVDKAYSSLPEVELYKFIASQSKANRELAYAEGYVDRPTKEEIDALYEQFLLENVRGYADMSLQEKILAQTAAGNPFLTLYDDTATPTGPIVVTTDWESLYNGGGGGGAPAQGSGLSSLASLIENLALPNGVADKAMQDVITELETVKGELQGLRADLIAAVNSLANRPIAVNGKIITDIVGQGILRKARATFG